MAKQPNWTPKEDKILKDNWITKTKKEIHDLFPNRTWVGIAHRANRIKAGFRDNTNKERGYNAKYNINEDFFKKWGQEQAYVFGRMLTDGHWRLRKSGGDLTLKSIDQENLEKIRFIMGSNHKIKKSKAKGNYIYIFSLYNNEVVRDIQKIYDDLKDVILKRDFFNDFLRGFMDGDGGIYIRKGVKVTLFSANKHVLELIKERLGYGVIYNTTPKFFTLNYLGKDAEKFCSFIYGERRPFLYLSRKLSRWELWQAIKGV